MKKGKRLLLFAACILSACAMEFLLEKKLETSASKREYNVWEDAWGVKYLFLPPWDEQTDVENVNVLYSAHVPSVEITTESGGMENFKVSKAVKESGTIEIVGENGAVSYSGKIAEIRSRGNVTFCMEKQPYQFKLEKPADLLGMGTAKTWLLVADFVDESGIRNVIALDMAERAGMEYVPEWRAVDLYCNGTYWGSYLMMEKIEVSANRMDIWNGFLLERDLEERWQQEEYGFISDDGDHYVQHYPKGGKGIGNAAQLMNRFEAAVKQPDGKNPETGGYYAEYIDLDSFVKKFILEEILLNYDAGATSAYYYIDEEGTIFAGPPWDYDAAMGNSYLNEQIQNPEVLALGRQHPEGTMLYEYLWSHEDFRRRVAEIYEADFRPFIEELLDGGINDYTDYFLSTWFMNYIRWRYSVNPDKYYENYVNDLRYLKYFFDRRERFLDSIWLSNETQEDRSWLWKSGETHRITYEVDGEVWKIDEVEDGFLPENLPCPEGYEGLDIVWKKKGNELEISRYKPVFEDVTWILFGIDN